MDISSISNYEYVAIIANYHGASAADFIDPRLLQRGYTPEQLEVMMQRAQAESWQRSTTSLNLEITGDLKRFKYDEFDYVVTLYNVYDKSGTLPYAGSTSEQPAKILEIFNLIEQLNLERRQREQAEHERKAKRNV